MDQAQLNWITSFIWNIADDVLRDVFVRGKYRDVILPMTVLRRLDAVLEPTKAAVLEMKVALDKEKITNQDDALRAAAGQAFYNTSPFLLRDLKSRKTQQTLKDDFIAYLDGFSPNVQDIIKNFEFRNQIGKLVESDGLGQLIEKFLDKDINLSPRLVGELPGLDNNSMGTVFEDLVRMFNEDNNEEAGQHWTPRDAVKLMASLMFLPVADKIKSGAYLLYDCACGTGGMLTVADETLHQIAEANGKQITTHLYGQEINAETYAFCKADLLLKGDGDAADNIVGGPAFSTPTQWFRPLRKNMGKKNCELAPEDIQRICDTFLAFQATSQSKIFPNAAFGYWKVKVERPLRLHSQLTRQCIEPLRYASGDEDIRAALYAELGEALFTDHASVRSQLEKLVNDWGKADSEGDEDEEGESDTPKKSLSDKKKKKLLSEATWKRDAMLLDVANQLRKALGEELFEDHNVFLEKVAAAFKKLDLKPSATELKFIVSAVSWRDETAPPVIKKIHKPGKGAKATSVKADPLHGLYEVKIGGKTCVVEYEPNSELRDFEQIPLLEEGGIEAFIRREVLPYTPDAWLVEADTKIGYEVSFTRHFYQPPQLRTLAEISADILALEQETEGLLHEITKGATA